MDQLLFWLFVLFICIAFYYDITSWKIPNVLVVTGCICGFIYHMAHPAGNGFSFAGFGFLTGLVVMFLLYGIKVIGAGDVKLFGAIGSFAGWEVTSAGIVYSLLAAGAIALAVVIYRISRAMYSEGWIAMQVKLISKNGLLLGRKTKFPFMYAVLPGITMAVISGWMEV